MLKFDQRTEYALTKLPSSVPRPLNEPQEDAHASPSLLHRYRLRNERPQDDQCNSNYRRTKSRTGVLAWWSSVMSRDPLLSRSISAQGTGSYGQVPNFNAINEAPDHDGIGGIKERERRKAKSSASGADNTAGGSNSSRHRQQSRSSSRDTLNATAHTTENHEGGDSGEETVDVDGDNSDENPPDDSPYPQVRASVSSIDDTSLSISTPRMWTLSMLCALFGSSSNLFFSLRYPSVFISPVIALVIVHPLGLAWDKLLKRENDPIESFDDGVRESSMASSGTTSRTQKLRLWLAQGQWNEKEHACVYIGSNVSFGFAFATDVIVEQTKFYHQDLSIVYQLLLTISTQILGYSFAGITRRYLVRPPSMIWPGTLMSTAMFTTMHKSKNKPANGWNITRWKFFLLVWFGSFAWYFIPGLLMPALSYFNVLTWFAPKNVVIANLFGVSSGLGLFPLTFDWAQIAYIGSPLLTPWWAAANVVGGLVVVMWIIAPIMYYKNVFYSAYMPILSSAVFDDTGKPYDVSKILTKDFLFDREAYRSYSKVYLPITYALSYGVQFAGLSALITHTVAWHGKEIWQQTMKSFSEDRAGEAAYQPISTGASRNNSQTRGTSSRSSSTTNEPKTDGLMGGTDVHNRLMQRYEDAPLMWYLATFLAMLAIGIFVVEYYPVYLPWYGLILALGITALLFIPVGIVMAITNQQSSSYLICQLICGAVFPGRPVANMVFVTYSYISSAQGLKFASDLKLGHYMKIPPKILFKVQMAATLVASVTQIGVLNWMFARLSGICTPDAINGFTCPIARVHFNGSILWGVVGPQRFFGDGALYRPLVWAFLVGFIAPLLVWLIGRRSALDSVWRKINLPVVFGTLSYIPPATGLNFSVWAVVCFSVNSLLRRRATAWWGKYTMTLSAALDSGLAFAVVVIFFGIIYPGWMRGFTWWGTEVYRQVSLPGSCDDDIRASAVCSEGRKTGVVDGRIEDGRRPC
ncbi:hypothetical protein MMC07_004929 [Pseudocyphellaria aurata]|nr:hypothetical protein [Pseudocyphellaria aurata]